MPLNYSFFADAGETPQTLEERRRRADLLASQIGGGTANVGEGIGDLFRGIGSGLSRYRTNKMQKAGDAGARSGMDKLMGIMYGNTANQNVGYGGGQPGDVLARAGKSIAGIESGGDYSATGPVTRTGDRAYGKYQVMGANIPEWTEAALGQRLTPEQFLGSKEAQEAVFNHRFGGYLKDYSPQDAASMWFTGQPLSTGEGRSDQLGTSGQEYADQFMAGMGGDGGMPMVPQLATYTPPQPQPAGGPQSPQMAPQAPPAPQGPAPMAPAQQVADAQMQPASGEAAMIPQIMEMLRNPFVSDQDKAFLQQRLVDIQKKQDPMYQMGLEKSQIELERLRDPSKTPLDPIQAAQLAQIQQQIKDGNYKVVGNSLIDMRTGKSVFEDPPEPLKPTTNMQDYDAYAKDEMAAGRQPLGRLEYETTLKKSGATSINNTVGGETLTPGWKKIDEKYADDYVEWRATGGFADIDKQLGQLDSALDIIEKNPGITGPAIGNLPDWAQAIVNPDGTIAQEYVSEVVQRNLRVILGAQFTEREGERLIARAYNPRLETTENAKRVRRLITQIKTMAATKEAAASYFDEKGTLMGFKGIGKMPKLSDLDEIKFGDEGRKEPSTILAPSDPVVDDLVDRYRTPKK